MAGLGPSFPLRLQQILSAGRPTSPALKLESDPPAKVKSFIDRVIKSPLHDIAIPLSGFRWEYNKGNFHHWRPLFMHFDTYFKTYISSRKDLLLSDCIIEEDGFPKQSILQILRVMQIILENCHNKGSFNGLEHFKLLLASTDPDIIIATLETLSSLMKINLSKLHGSGKLISCGSMNSHLLSLAQGWGSKEEGLGLYSCVLANERNQQEGFSLFPPDMENECDAIQCRLGSTLHFEFNVAAPQDSTTYQGKKSKLHVINIPGLHMRKEDDLVILKECIEKFSVPPEHRFSLLTRIRYARAFRSPRMCRLYSKICILAFIVLVQSNDAHDELVSFFANEPEYTNELIRLVRSEESIPATIRALAMLALGAQLAAYASSHERARIFSGSSIISVGGNRMVLLSVLQKAIASLSNPSDPSSPLFVDALLQFFLLHVLSSSSSSSVLRVSGMVPPLLPLLSDSDPSHIHLVCAAVKTLQKLMEYSTTAVSVFKDNGGVELLSEKLRIEVDKVIDTNEENSNAMVIGDASKYDEDYLYSQKRLVKLLLKALGSATYSQGNPTRSQNLSNSVSVSLSQIFRNVNKFGGDIYFSAVTVMSEIIHKDPSCFQMLDDAGLPEAFLASVVSGVLPASKALACLPTGLGAICLNNKGLEAVKESSALRFLVDTFTRRKYLVAMNEGVVLLANAVEELLRHVSSLRSTGVDIIIEIINKLASLGEGKCSESSSGESVNTAMETDSNDKTTEGHDLVSVMDPNADGISGEQFVQLCIFHVMVLVHRTMENSETCRLFVEKGGIEILLKLLLRPSITQSSEGMPIALHSTLVFKGFTQHHSVPLARAFCFSLRDHLKRALGGFRSVAGSFLLAQQTTMDAESFASLFVVEFLLFLAASKDNRWISTLLTEFGDSNKDVLEDIGRLQREVLWQVALLQGSELEKEFESTEPSNDVQKTNASTNEFDDQRFSSFRQYLDPLLRRRVSGWSVESQFSDLISIYRDIGRVAGGRRTGSESYFTSRFSSNRQQSPGNSSDLSVNGKTEDEKRRSYYSLCRDMMRSLSYHCNLLFMELGKAMLLASRRENNPAVLPSSVVSVATVVSSIMSDHLTFSGYVNPSESDVSISTKCRYLGKVVDFVDGVLTDRPESCNPIIVSCLHSCGVIQAILTTFEATSQLLFTLNGVPAPSSPMDTDDASLRLDKDEADNSWIFAPLMSYCMLMDHLATSSFILSSSTKQLLDQPLVSGNVSFPPDAESFVKLLQSKVLKAILPIWTHSHFAEFNLEFVGAVVSIMKHVLSGVEVRNTSGTAARTAGPPPDESAIEMIVEMGFTRARAEEALRQAGTNSVEIATDWLFTHPEEPQEDAELARALAMSLGSTDSTSKDVEVADANDLKHEEEEVHLPVVDDLLTNSMRLLQVKESSAFAVRDLLLMICSQNDGQNRSKVLNFVIDHIKLCPSTSARASSMTLSALFHVLSLILHEDVAAREIASKTGFVNVSLGLLLDWDRTLQDDHNFEVPKWVTACFLSIDRMLQFDSKLAAENIDLVQLKQNKSTQNPVSIEENRKNDCSSPLSLISGNLDRDNQKHLLEILCRCIKRQLPSETMHVVLQLCATLTKAHSIAVNFLEYGGLHALLSLPASSLFSGFNTVATAIIRHILEDPHTLQQAMELEIRHSLVAATSRHSNARMTPRNFVQNLALVISRDPAVFIQAVQAVCQIEMVGDRPYVVLLKDRDKDKTKEKDKDKEKVVEKEKQFGTDSKTTIGDLTIGAASSGQGKVQDTNTKISKVHKRSAQSFTSVIEHLMDVIFSFIPSKVDDVVGTSLGTPSTEMDIDSSSAKGKGKAIALPKEDVKTTNEEVSTSLAKTVFVLKLLTEILLTYTSSMHVILRRDAELRSSRSSQKGLPFVGGGFFHHILHRFVPCPGTHKKDKKAEGDWRQKLASRANQFLVASSIRSSEGRKRVFYEISNVFNEFVGTAVGCKAPNASMHCFVDLLNDILAARSPVGSNISSEASVTFIDVGLVQSLTKTLDILDLDHSDSAKIVSGVVKALELVTREYVHSSGINSAKGNSSNLTSDQNQVDSNIGGDRFQSLETTLHPGHSEAAVEHMEAFGLAQTPRSSDDMDHEQDLDVSFARDTEDDFMHETSEEGGVLENGISTVEITFELPHNASEGLGDEDEDDDMSEDGDGDEVEEDEDEDEDEDENNDLEEDDVQMLHPDTDHDDHEIEDEEFDEDVLEEEDEDDEGVILRLEEGVNGMNVFDHIEVLSGGNNFPGGALLLGRRQEFAASMSNRLGRANDHGVNTEHPLLVDPSSFLVQRRQSENAVDLAFSDGRHDGSSSRLDAIFQTLRSGRHGHRFSMWLDDSQQRSSSNVVPEGIEELLLSQLRRPTPAEPSSHDGAESLQQKDEPDPLQNSENHAGEQVGVQGENNDNMLVSTPVSLPDAPRDSHDESSSGLIQERETSGANEQMCEMQFEQNDAAVRDVEAVSQASSGSGATLGESLRSLEVEIGSVDGHDDGERQERQGPAERVPSGDLHQISRTRRSSGTVVPVSGRDASLESVSEVPAGPSQEANQNILLAENPVIRNADSDSIDPTFLEALPEELRAEVLSSRQNQVAQTSSDQSQAEGEIDPEFLAALPPDIREEVLAQQRAQRQSQPQELAGQPVEMDAVSIIATFPSEIREEVLLTSPDTLLATLTPALVAEANMLRERFAHRYHSNALLGLQPRSRRGDHSRRGDLIGSNTDRSAVASASRRSAAGKLIEAAGNPLVGTDALKALVRLLRVVQPLYKGQFQRLLLNLCAHQDTRTSLVQILMDMLMLDLRGSITTDTDVTDPPFRLYGCQSYIMYSRPQFSDGVPPLVSRRLLETLTFLARNHQYVAKILLHHEVSYIKGFEVGASNQGPGKAVRMEEDNPEDTIGKGDFSVVVLLRLLNQPLYMRSIAHLEQLLNLLEVIMIHAESDVDLQNKSLSSTEQQSVPEGVVQDIQVNNETQTVVQDAQPNAATPTGEGCSSMTQKNARAVLTGLPQAELRLLCSLLAREGLSDNAYVLAAEVLKRLVAVVPTFCHLFILELAKSMHNLVASGMNELHLNDGETERALLASSTTSGTAILRVLQALGSLVSVLHDKKDPQLISENEYSGALSQVSEVNSSLESLWLELSSCISKIESSSDSTGDVDIILGNLANVGSSSPLPAGSQNILPYIESFFVTCEKLHPGQLDVNQELVIATASDLEDVSTSGQKLSGFSVKVDEKYGAFVKFSEKHRKLLNAFIRQNPGLLEKSFSLMLKVPRFIDFDNKRAHFRSKIKHQHDHHHSPVRISVRRAYILEDSYNQLRMRSPQDLKGRLTVHFQGEEGIDAGGLTREWYQLLSRVIFDKGALLFTTVGNESTFQPNPNSVYQTEHLSYFKFVGRVVGKALFDGQLLDVHFTRSFYKHILGVKVTYHDIEAIDPDYYKNLKWMLENDISDVLDLTFSVDADEEKLILYEKAEVTDHELIPGGRNRRVTEENKREYVDLVVEHRLTTAIRPQINAFLEGFNELTPRDLISIFNDRELELLISGLPDIDLDDLRANTEYSGYSNASPIIQWFWDVLQVFSKEDKARFLQFVTGTSKVPLEGFSALQGISGAQRFQIHKAYGSPNHLPSAHTCFNQLDLPEYPSKEQLHERLLLAIHEGSEGFGFG